MSQSHDAANVKRGFTSADTAAYDSELGRSAGDSSSNPAGNGNSHPGRPTTSAAKRQEKFDVSAAVAGLRVAEEQLRIAQRFVEQPITEITECPLCGLHPHDFTVEEYEREVDRLQKIIDGLRSESHA